MTTFWLVQLAPQERIEYDAYDKFVIEAESELEARRIAVASGGDYCTRFGNPAQATCVPLERTGQPRVVVGSFNAG